MNRRGKTVLTIVFAVLVLAGGLVLAVLGYEHVKSGSQIVPYINDGAADWSQIGTVEIYGEGCALPPTLILEGEQDTEAFVEAVSDIREYRRIAPSRYLEGTNDVWVRFDNGVCIGMYRNENYGYIGTEMSLVGQAPFYRVPEKLRKLVFEKLDDWDYRIRIFQGSAEVVPYEGRTFVAQYEHRKWVIGDAVSPSAMLPEIGETLPEAVWAENLAIRIPETAEFEMTGIELLSEACERIAWFQTKEEFYEYCRQLEPGSYYVSVSAVKYGDYIESEKQYNRYGYEYLFRLTKE